MNQVRNVPELLKDLREPVQQCFAGREYTVGGEARTVNPWQGNLYIRLTGMQEGRTQEMTVFVPEAVATRISFDLQEGSGLIITGHIMLSRDELQLYAHKVTETGFGVMQTQIQEWDRKYLSLFQRAKKIIPPICREIAVVSSERAQGYTDFISHFDNGGVTLYPCQLQGEGAAKDIAGAIAAAAHAGRFDCICVVRGGGSFADLFPFNMPDVLLAIAGSPIPVAVAVGHESDKTLSDKMADASFATPTALAMALTGRKQQYLNAQVAREKGRQHNRQLIAAGVIIAALAGIVVYLLR